MSIEFKRSSQQTFPSLLSTQHDRQRSVKPPAGMGLVHGFHH